MFNILFAMLAKQMLEDAAPSAAAPITTTFNATQVHLTHKQPVEIMRKRNT
jgi:hypothetical protein